MRSGVLAAGNWICDHVKTIDTWPEQDGLANILGHTVGNGGGPYNLLKDLSRMRAPFPLSAIGLLGDDADGRLILADCKAHGIDVSQLAVAPEAATGSTDVMTVRGTGRRTFFHNAGANARLLPGNFNFSAVPARVFYLGYLLLLDGLDAPGADGAPRAREVFRSAKAAGMETALDCVSAPGGRFRDTVEPVLPEVDVLFANDYEAEQLTGLSLGRAKALDRRAVADAARRLAALGVRKWSIVHFPEGACACSAEGEIVWQPAVRVPQERIAGSVGAGDAFAAGVLYGVHEQWPMPRSLELGVCAAARSLLHATCSEGVVPSDECLRFGRELGAVSF